MQEFIIEKFSDSLEIKTKYLLLQFKFSFKTHAHLITIFFIF